MRGITGAILALAPALSLSLVLPETGPQAGSGEEGHDGLASGVELSYPSYARLRLPFPEPYDNAFRLSRNNTLVFHLNVLESLQRCGYGNITVNGHGLNQAGTNTSSHGRGLVPALSNQGSKDHVLDAEWEFSCLHDQPLEGPIILEDEARAQFLSFKINKIDGKPVNGDSGFTASFRQSPDSQLLRIEPEILPVPDSSSAPEWLDQSAESIESEENDSNDENQESTTDSFDVEIAKLKKLKYEAKQLRKAIKEQKRVIWRLFKAELKRQLSAAKDEIRNCESIRCAFHTALHRMGTGFKYFHMKFCSGAKHKTTDGHLSRLQRFWTLPWNRSSSSMVKHGHGHGNLHKSQSAFSFPKTTSNVPGKKTLNSTKQPQSKTKNHFKEAAFIAAEIMAFILIPVSLFLIIYHHCSHSRRAERRWQRESRRAARAIANAHRRRTFRNWWKNLGRDPRITDYEEKRALVLEQEQVLESAMQREIRELRAAAEVVSSMVSGEDERSTDRSFAGPNMQPQHSQSRRDSLPDYRSEASYGDPPPGYESEEADGASLSGVVVDGFQYGNRLGTHYAPSSTVSTPRSSVFGSNAGSDYSSDEDGTGAKD